MAYVLSVNIPDTAPQEFTLADGRFRIGRKPECEICIDMDEVGSVAAHVDVRGEAVFIRNLNPFPIYVGEQELSSSQQGEWPAGQSVLLTQSVSLELFDMQVQGQASDAEQSAQRSRSTMQIAIVVLCIAAAYFLLAGDSAPRDSTKALDYSFTDLVADLDADKSNNFGIVQNYLIDARVSDVRWGREDPRRAITAYQLLLDEPEIQAATDLNSVQGRIRQFALARLDDLAGQLTAE